MGSKMHETYSFQYYTAVVATFTALIFGNIIANTALAAGEPAKVAVEKTCAPTDTACLLPQLETLAQKIENVSWRDQTLRELAKLYMAKGMSKEAIAIIPRVETPDTRAMTIRGIGMEAAKLKLPQAQYNELFAALRVEADKIEHAPSLGIALTYIAMAQAFAGDDAGAMKTAHDMTNAALRHKAFGETAEIQAERGDLNAALASLAAIDDLSFRNKAHGTVAKLFADRHLYAAALETSNKIDNDYQRSQVLLYILAKQITPAEVTLGIKE